MRDLYRCLEEYSDPQLAALADLWQAGAWHGDRLEAVQRLGDAMLLPGAAERVVSDLSAEARDALAELATQGGSTPAQRLTLRFGAIRRLGPARLAREQPWLHPANGLEELYYKGLLYRAYAQADDVLRDLLFIPAALLARLPQLQAQPLEWTRPLASPPPEVAQAGRVSIEDMFAMLVALRQTPLPSAETVFTRLVEQGRLSGARTPERDALLWRLMERLELVRQDNGLFQPSPGVREWLRLADGPRLAGMLAVWRDDPGRDELYALPGLRCEARPSPGRASAARSAVWAMLIRFPAGAWFPLEALVRALQRHQPDFLRPDGEAVQFVRDASTGEYLDGPEAWPRIEGALARYLLVGPLHWLGLVDLAGDGDAPNAFRLTPAATLAATSPVSAAPRAHPGSARATVTDDLHIHIALEDTLYERYQLERLAEWCGQDVAAHYALTEESLWRSHSAGIPVDQVAGFLQRITQTRVPSAAIVTLRGWGARLGKAALERMMVLTTRDRAIMQEIRRDAVAGPLLGSTFSPTACRVAEKHIEPLVRRLKEMGLWPKLTLGS